jgi:WD40 repeat protein
MENINTTTWSYPQGASTERGRATHLTVSPCGKKFAYGSLINAIVRDSSVNTQIFKLFPFLPLIALNLVFAK